MTRPLTADRRLWLDAAKERVIEHSEPMDPRAAFQLVAPGRTIPPREVERLSLTADEDGRIVLPEYDPEPKPEPEPLPMDVVLAATEGEDDADTDVADSARTIRFGGEPEAETEAETPLPEDFPAAELLAGAGFGTVEAVSGASDEDLRAINGIGPATLGDIREALG